VSNPQGMVLIEPQLVEYLKRKAFKDLM